MQYEVILFTLEKQHGLIMKRRLKEYGLNKGCRDAKDQARAVISSELEGPSKRLGYRGMWNKLRTSYGINLPRDEVMKLLRELDPDGCVERRRRKLKRRTYTSNGPNSAWHVDGYDKLKPYGLPITGCVDGFSRQILWLKVIRSNNNPVVPAKFYLDAISSIGACPRLLCTDCRTENGIMAGLQCFFLDDVDSHRYGSSHANQRIENWWSHFRTGYTNWLINFFKSMVHNGELQLEHSVHMECVWFVFASFLQQELDTVREARGMEPPSHSWVIILAGIGCSNGII